ncbi:MAG: CARDB domain-containing protein [Mycobacteriales bacterium]
MFPAVIAGDDNRAAFAFLGTTTAGDYQDSDDPDDPNDSSFKGVWYLYVATTTDGGKSWVTVNVTPNDPVQRGSICTSGTTCADDRNLLDFMDLDLDAQGRGVVGYADGCTADCVTTENPTADTKGYHDAYATIARQSAGPRLFAQFDAKPDLVVTNLQLVKDSAGEHVSGLVKNIGKATASNVVVLFREGCGCGTGFQATTSPAFTLAPGKSKRVGVLDPRKLTGSHTYTAIVDPANVVAESNEGNNKARKSFVC